MEILDLVAILVAGLMVGSELSIAAFVHPTLNRLQDNVHLPVASALARVLGTFTPYWYVLVFWLTSTEVYIQWHNSGRLPIWVGTSAILWALAIWFRSLFWCRSTTVSCLGKRSRRLLTGRPFEADGICFTAGVLCSSP